MPLLSRKILRRRTSRLFGVQSCQVTSWIYYPAGDLNKTIHRYCGSECQRKGWSAGHRWECGIEVCSWPTRFISRKSRQNKTWEMNFMQLVVNRQTQLAFWQDRLARELGGLPRGMAGRYLGFSFLLRFDLICFLNQQKIKYLVLALLLRIRTKRLSSALALLVFLCSALT